jgi:hypothetical protein
MNTTTPVKAKPSTAAVLRRMKRHMTKMNVANFNKDGLFRCNVRAGIIKAFEFTLVSQRKQAEPYFQMATLRGICEDLIVLSFLQGLPDRDAVVSAIMDSNLAEGLSVQTHFFQRERAWQPIVREVPSYKMECEKKLSDLAQKYNWKKGGRWQIPSVRTMAKASSMLDLYDFFYSTSSKLVHFSPHILMRMGWGSPEVGRKVSKDTDWSFSTKNFANYYADFNRTYSTFLFMLITRKFVDEFSERDAMSSLLDELDEQLDSKLRWPEVVTHEELNHEAPGTITRLLLRAQHEIKAAN